MIKEEYDNKPSSVILFKDGDIVRVTVNCNITPKTKEVYMNDKSTFTMCCYHADSNSFEIPYEQIDWDDLIRHPEKYLEY